MIFNKFMSFCALYIVPTVFVLSKASAGNAKYWMNVDTAVNVTSTCGGVITDPRGRISYKVFEPLLPNERCVWIIRSPKAGEYDVYLDSLGIPGSLIISAHGDWDRPTAIVPTSPDDFYIPNQNVLVITLYTGPENSTEDTAGFSLLFVGTATATGKPTSENSTHQFISANSGHHKFPIGRDLYDNYELSTFVVTPVTNSNGSFQKTEVVFTLKGLEKCRDRLENFWFNPSLTGANKWHRRAQICGDKESVVITNQDLILLVFESDLSVVNSGFHLYTHVDNC